MLVGRETGEVRAVLRFARASQKVGWLLIGAGIVLAVIGLPGDGVNTFHASYLPVAAGLTGIGAVVCLVAWAFLPESIGRGPRPLGGVAEQIRETISRVGVSSAGWRCSVLAWVLGLRPYSRVVAWVVGALAAVGVIGLNPAVASATTQTYSAPGSYPFTVPANVTHITVTAVGAGGGPCIVFGSTVHSSGGRGATVTATVPVSPRETLEVGVGGVGGVGCLSVEGRGAEGGAGGGGRGGAGPFGVGGAGGGGASGVRRNRATSPSPGVVAAGTAPMVVAAGGGGGAGYCGVNGGDAGSPGADGSAGCSGRGPGPGGGGGAGTQSGGGVGGVAGSAIAGAGGDGSPGNGGIGGFGETNTTEPSSGGGGGGGGYYGGGGGGGSAPAGDGGGGGGGSSFTASDATAVSGPTLTTGPAMVKISYLAQPAPAVRTGLATAIGATTAMLHGTVNPEGLATSYEFQYGTTTAYGSSAPSASAGSDKSSRAVSASVRGLKPDRTYHYRLVASNASGTTDGADETFTTPARALKLSVFPTRIQAGRRACFAFRATSNGHPVAGATVRFASHTARTSHHGKATICLTLHRGTYHPSATKNGYRRAHAIVTATAPKRAELHRVDPAA